VAKVVKVKPPYKTDLTMPYNHNKIFQECVMIVRLS
jgi:hypothetical protein